MKFYCRPRWLTAAVLMWVATVATGLVYDFSFWWFLVVWAPFMAAVIFTGPYNRRLPGQSILACKCPRHLEEVPVEDRPEWGGDKF